MKILYRITSPDVIGGGICYAFNLRDADRMAALVMNNGYRVRVQRLRRTQVPKGEEHLILLEKLETENKEVLFMIQEDYVSFETAKLLKEAGFDWKQYSFYNSEGILINGTFAANWNDKIWDIDGSKISAPTLAIAQRWLREIKELNVEISTWPGALWRWVVWLINPERRIIASKHQNYKSYEEALEEGIKETLEMILEKRE